MRGGTIKQNGPRAYERLERIREIMEDVAEKLKAHHPYNYWAVYFYHDLGGDARILTEFAARWEDHCRKTGQTPFRWTNEDGTIDRGD